MNAQRRIEERILAEHKLIAERLSPTVRDHARDNLRRWASRYPADKQPLWMREWADLLAGDEDRLIEVLTSPSEEARRLRSSSPFAGVISPRERWALHKELEDSA